MDIRRYIEMGKPLPLGKAGESGVTSYKFGYGDYVEDYGAGTLSIMHQRPGDTEPQAVTITTEDNMATWDITSTDTAYAGTGRLQVKYVADGAVVKTMIGTTIIEPSL